MDKKRIEWVDISKGLGILLVIFGHCVYYGHFAHNWIFSFHMQLFFIISGLFIREEGFLNTVKKRFKQLIIPYMVFCVIGFIITMIIPEWRHITLKDILRDIYLGYPNAVNVSSIWFLVCLYVSILVFSLVCRIRQNNKILAASIFAVIILYGFALGRFPEVLLPLFPVARMPLESDCACIAILFLAMGYYFKERIFKKVLVLEKKKSVFLWFGFGTTLLGTIAVAFFNGTVNLHGLMYNNELIYILGGGIGFAFIMFASLLAERSRIISRFLQWGGVNSLAIMGVQAIVVRIYVLSLNKLLKERFSLYLLPPRYAVLGCVIVGGGSLMIVWMYNFATDYISRLTKANNDNKK